jgi:hypothetical protein
MKYLERKGTHRDLNCFRNFSIYQIQHELDFYHRISPITKR